MHPISPQNVRVVVRLPYNRPANQEDQIVDPPKVGSPFSLWLSQGLYSGVLGGMGS